MTTAAKPLKWTNTASGTMKISGNLLIKPHDKPEAGFVLVHFPSGLGTGFTGKLRHCQRVAAELREAFGDLTVFDKVGRIGSDAFAPALTNDEAEELSAIGRWIRAWKPKKASSASRES